MGHGVHQTGEHPTGQHPGVTHGETHDQTPSPAPFQWLGRPIRKPNKINPKSTQSEITIKLPFRDC
jgi:hypothetical protein